MFNDATPNDYEALARMTLSPDGQRFVALLRSELQRCMESLLTLNGEAAWLRVRGRGLSLRDLIDVLEGSPDVATKLKNRAKSR